MKKIASLLVLLSSVVVLSIPALAQQGNQQATTNPLLQLLQSKGVLTPEEVSMVNQTSATGEANMRLGQLLVTKGVISEQEYKSTFASTPELAVADSSSAHLVTAVYQQTQKAPQSGQATPAQATSPEASVVPAVVPLRVLPIDIPKQRGLIPDIKLGSGVNMKLYGFFKATAIEDTASSGGATFGSNDFPLPLMLGGDTGPTSNPQFRVKARFFRFGSQFEWTPKDSKLTLTGKLEADYEGDYTNVNNRNISSVRSSQLSLRLAYMRFDTKLGGTLPWFAEFGQDWSLLSSTLPNLFETTGLGLGMGSLYERMPQFKTGVQFHSGDLKIQPEFAIVLPVASSGALTDEQRARFGDRAGADSNQPGVEGRLVFQFPLGHWPGVAPAQIIFSGHHARMNEIIPHAAQVPTTCTALPCTTFASPSVPNVGFTTTTSILNASNCTTPTGICNLGEIFARGAEVGNSQNIWTAELQLPTPWVTFVTKFYKGNDMRFFFAGQLNDVFSSLNGLFNVGNGISFSGRSLLFGCAGGTTTGQPANTVDCQGTPVLSGVLRPIGGVGGFAELSFPLSRIFHASPEGRNSGWVLHLQYSTDRANAADVVHGNGLARTDLDTVALTYKLNKWISLVNEGSYIVTRAATANSKFFAGRRVTQAHDWRNEFGPVFTF